MIRLLNRQSLRDLHNNDNGQRSRPLGAAHARRPLRRTLQPLPNSPPSYRGVSEAVSPPHVRARPSHTLLTPLLSSLAHLLSVRARGSSTMAGEAAGDGCGPELA
eukprot:scaffold14001_cov53-Phaeocystis_antarctica.AAC.2